MLVVGLLPTSLLLPTGLLPAMLHTVLHSLQYLRQQSLQLSERRLCFRCLQRVSDAHDRIRIPDGSPTDEREDCFHKGHSEGKEEAGTG